MRRRANRNVETPKRRNVETSKRQNVKTSKWLSLRRFDVLTFLSVLSVTLPGCVRRTMTITTEPPSALVFLNDQEIGRTALTTDFLWYGDYDVIIRKEGYETLQTHWRIKPPWYQIIPFDFFAEVLWPGRIHDRHEKHFVLTAAEKPPADELIDRALETREKALDSSR